MPRELERRKFLTSVGAVATTAVAGCSGGSSDDPTDTESTVDGGDGTDPAGDGGTDVTTSAGGTDGSGGGELQMLTNPIGTLDPIGATGSRDNWVIWQTHESLFTYEGGTTPAVGDLATDYTVSDDYLTYEFTLKEGVTFHDGSELTASDVVYSWRRLAESDNNRGNTDHIVNGVMNVAHEETEDGEIVPDSLAIEATGEYTVEMTLETPFHSTLGQIAAPNFAPIPEGIVGDIEGYDGEYEYDEWASNYATGTGPFQLESWSSGNEVIVSRFEEYHGSVANIDGIRWQIIEDPNARYTRAVNEQNADIFDIPRSQFDPSLLELTEERESRALGTYGPVNGTTLNYGQAPLPQTQFLQCNTLNVEKSARQALAYAIDQNAIVEEATKGLGEPAYFITPPVAFPDGPEEYDRIAEEYPYGYGESDIAAARQVMEDAGYSQDNMYETAFQIKSDTRASVWESVASYVRDLAQTVHIDLTIEPAPSSTLVNRAIEGNIDIFGNYMDLSWIEADAGLQYSRPTPSAWTRWGQGEDGMTEAAQRAADAWDEQYLENRIPTDEAQAARNEAYLTMERANWEDAAQIPLWHPTTQLYWYDWVEDYEFTGPLRRTKFNDVSIGDRS